MVRKVYNKLVRDRIPEIIKKSGLWPRFRTLSRSEFKKELLVKLQEEVDELKSAKTRDEAMEELADIFEVVRNLVWAYGFETFQFDNAVAGKWTKKGGFGERIFLEYVEKRRKS